MCSLNEVTQQDLYDLLEIFEKKPFEATAYEEGTPEYAISKKCEYLFKLDYSLIELDNKNGTLSPRYPGQILIPEYEHGHMSKTLTTKTPMTSTTGNAAATIGCTSNTSKNSSNIITDGGIQAFVTFANSCQQSQLSGTINPIQMPIFMQGQSVQQQQQQAQVLQQQQQNTIYEDQYDMGRVRELIGTAKYARCRQRFVVPVIMFRGKYICRSATISVMSEIYGRKVVDYAYDCISGTNNIKSSAQKESENDAESTTDESLINEQSQFSYDEVIKTDIQLLNVLNVSSIIDLMVEMRKIKYFMAVSSSEKADPSNHYHNFNLLSLPYPGCEFFKNFRDNNYMASNLFYNWQQSFNDADVNIPNNGPAAEMDINWTDYQKWDLVKITQNYLKATLKYIHEENSGLLIHCISGWDRTPLFISLVRLSLWADGHIHQSLNAMQMAYFTLAYDWFLFGHQLPDRLRRGEDIMFFCFHVLKYIVDDEYSITEHRKRTKTSSSSGSSVVVIKSDMCDEEQQKEDYTLSLDADSNESVSNSSNCDMAINDNFYATTPANFTNPLTNRSPNFKRSRTSPISVPTAANAMRYRHESTSSNGSWQVVTDTGSIDSTINGSFLARFASPRAENSNIPIGNGGVNAPFQTTTASSNNGSSGGIGNVNIGTSNTLHGTSNGSSRESSGTGSTPAKPVLTLRHQRLSSVRAIFITAYGKTIGLKFQEGSQMNLASFIGNFF